MLGGTIIGVETGDAYTNSIGKELLFVGYMDLVLLVDSIDAVLSSIAFSSNNAQFIVDIATGGRTAQIGDDQMNRIRDVQAKISAPASVFRIPSQLFTSYVCTSIYIAK